MSRFVTRFGWWAGALLALGTPSLVLAQGNIFNPYGNSGYADYREFGSPKYATDPGLPNRARVGSGFTGSRYNTFDEFSNSLDSGAESPAAGTRSYSGMPFYRAYQLEAQQARRSARPVESADQAYRQRLAERNTLYFRALNTADPKERARLLREVDRLTARDSVDRPPAANAGQAANRSPAAATAPPLAPRTTPAPASNRATPTPGTAPGRTTTQPRPAPVAPAAAPTPGATGAATRTTPAPAPPPATNPASVPVPSPG